MAAKPVSEPRCAGLARRLAAMFYDALLILAIWMITLLVMVVANGGEPVLGAPVQTLLFLEAFTFFAYFWTRAGQTAGMRAWRLRLESNDGGRVSLHQVTLRFAVALIAFGAFGIGYFWALIDRQGRTWPDIASNSRVMQYAD
ncbi:MAG: RDD family protein [Gammaproteobacteria bacterium]|nr:RDD family protein [Gammaproteobacteria bacterium]